MRKTAFFCRGNEPKMEEVAAHLQGPRLGDAFDLFAPPRPLRGEKRHAGGAK